MNKKINFLEQEQLINQYKRFFKTHLINLSNRQEVLAELDNLRKIAKKTESRVLFNPNPELTRLEIKIDNFLQENFDKKVIKLYNKEIYDVSDNVKDVDTNKQFLLELVRGISEIYIQSNIKVKKQWEYKIKVLDYIYEILYNYGLHPNISKRIPETNKRFNLIMYHNYRRNEEINDCKIMMTYKEFEKIFINQYSKQKPISISGKLIPFDVIHQIKITTTLLKDDEIVLFAKKKNFVWTTNEKDYLSFINYCDDETDTYLPNPFEELPINVGLNQLIIEEVKQLLILYPKPLNLYISALNKFNHGNYERNMLDDLRLSLELLLKEIFANNKSLEKQLSELGKYQQNRGATKETTNMFHKLFTYYTDYQNSYIKHNDLVQKSEVELIFDLTGTFIKYLIKK